MNTTNNILRSVLCCLVSLVATVAAMAENKVYIESFSIVPGEKATVNVMMDNDDDISSLQLDLNLPAGLTFEGNEKRNTERITRTSHTLNATDYPAVTKRFTIFAKAVTAKKTAIAGKSGVLFSFDVKADKWFNGGEVVLSNVVGSDATVVPAVEKPMSNRSLDVKANAGTFSLAPEAVSLTFAKKDTVDVYLANTIALTGLEARVNLPEGVEVVGDPLMGDRLSDNATVSYEAKSGKILIESITNDEFAETDAPLFSIVLKGMAEGTGTLSLSDVLVSNGLAAFKVEGTANANEVAVTVVDINTIVYNDLKEKLDSVTTLLNDTLAYIRNYTTEAGKAWADSEEADALVNELTEEGLYLEAAYQAGTLTEEYELAAKIDEYGARIGELAQKAADAEAKALIKIGDVNGDGEVTIADANMIVNYYLGNNPEGFVIEAADVNEDGEVTIADANAIANIYLGEK